MPCLEFRVEDRVEGLGFRMNFGIEGIQIKCRMSPDALL